MTLLKDIRLLLIVGLAIMCLLALRLCSSQYEPNTVGSTEKVDNAIVQTATPKANEAESESQQNGVLAENETGDAVEATTQTDTAAVAETEEQPEAAVVVEGDAETKTADVQTETADVQTETADAQTDGAVAAETETQTEAAPAQVVQVTEAVTEKVEAVYEVVPSTIAPFTTIESEKITLPATADTGNLPSDLQTDLGAVKDGIKQYGEQLDSIKSMFDKIKKPQ